MTTKQHQNAPKVHTSHITAAPAAIVTQIRRSTSERSNRDDAHCHCRWDSTERPRDGWVRSSATAKCETNDLFETIQSIVRFQSSRLCTDYWGSSNYTYCRGSCWFKIISVEKLLIAMNFLKCYQSEEVRSGQFRVSEEEQEIDSIASGFCILSLYWPFGYDRVVLVKRLRHSFSASLRHFTSLRQIRLRQNSLRNFQIV